MKNVDVPLWDKGDNTDDFTKGGGSKSFGFGASVSDKTKKIEKIFETVLGRKPSSKELSYYKYSVIEEDELIKKLLEGDEFKRNLEKLKEYPDLKETLRTAKMTVLKLKNRLNDQDKEFLELAKLIKEKNNIITDLRKDKNMFLTSDSFINDSGRNTFTELSVKNNENDKLVPKKILIKEDSFLMKIINLFKI